MLKKLVLHPDILFSSDENIRKVARALYQTVKDLPIISPHGHTDPSWFSQNQSFENATELLIKPDHYVFRMLYSQGIPLESLGFATSGISTSDVQDVETDSRKIWHVLAKNYYLYRGTPSRMWLDTVFVEVFGFDVVKTKHTTERMDVDSRELSGGRNRAISNGEMLEFVKNFTREISEGIVSEEINDQEPFIIKSKKWEFKNRNNI